MKLQHTWKNIYYLTIKILHYYFFFQKKAWMTKKSFLYSEKRVIIHIFTFSTNKSCWVQIGLKFRHKKCNFLIFYGKNSPQFRKGDQNLHIYGKVQDVIYLETGHKISLIWAKLIAKSTLNCHKI